jgi:hypothetical protein
MQPCNFVACQTNILLPRLKELKPGDYFMIEHPQALKRIPSQLVKILMMDDVLMYGQILDGRNCEAGFFNVIAYSLLSPNGEEGTLNIADITRVINRDEFESARREEWIV